MIVRRIQAMEFDPSGRICKFHLPLISLYMHKDRDPHQWCESVSRVLLVSFFNMQRIIRCGGPVDDDMANIIVSQLLYLDAVDPNKDIVMYINSPGGSVTAGMAIFDTMRHIRPDVSTVCVGLAARRTYYKFLLNASRANEMLHHKANLNGYLSYQTGQSLDKVNQDTDRDFFMSTKEAKEYGLIDGVITNPIKALQPLAAAAKVNDRAIV